jgi:DUF1680 family protein
MGLAYHDARYADLVEETLYNALLGGIALDGKTFYYPNPLDARTLRSTWHSVPCCVGNIPRTLLQMPTWMYSKDPDGAGIYVNQFVGSTVTLENVGGSDVEMVQETNYPWDGRVAITVNPKGGAKRMTIRVRVPSRETSALYATTPRVEGLKSLAVNGRAVRPRIENGYAVLSRSWKPGDRIELEVPLAVQRVRAIEKVEADRGKVALRYGPLVYNVEKVDAGDLTKELAPDAPLATEWRPDLLHGVVAITGRFADGSPLVAIPNYARMNREPEPPPTHPVDDSATDAPRERRAPPPIASIVWITEA